MAACKADGVPEPELRYEHTGLWTVFYYAQKQPEAAEVVGDAAQKGEKLGETRAAIVRAMLANPNVTVVQLAQALQISTTAVEKNLQHLKRQGYIERIGPAKGGHWKVKG